MDNGLGQLTDPCRRAGLAPANIGELCGVAHMAFNFVEFANIGVFSTRPGPAPSTETVYDKYFALSSTFLSNLLLDYLNEVSRSRNRS